MRIAFLRTEAATSQASTSSCYQYTIATIDNDLLRIFIRRSAGTGGSCHLHYSWLETSMPIIQLWGCNRTNSAAYRTENLFLSNALFFLNRGIIYFNIESGTLSAADLLICIPSLAPRMAWRVCPDLQGSDHFPVLIATSTPNRCRQCQR